MPFWSFGTKYICNSFRDIQRRIYNAVVDMTLIRPLNKGQGHSFWYNRFLIYDFGCETLCHINTTSYGLSLVTFALGRTELATIGIPVPYRQTTDGDRCNTVAWRPHPTRRTSWKPGLAANSGWQLVSN